MWMLFTDVLRRNWMLKVLLYLLIAFVLMIYNTSDNNRFILIQIYLYSLILAMHTGVFGDSDRIRVWRTLPYAKSRLENLLWVTGILTVPLALFLLALLMGLAYASPETGFFPSLVGSFILMIVTLLSAGIVKFFETALSLQYARVSAARNAGQKQWYANSFLLRILITLVPIGTALYMLLYPPPAQWSDFTTRHLVGAALALGMTWRSYQLRAWLLQPLTGKGSQYCSPATLEIPPPPRRSPAAVVWNEFKSNALGMLRVLLGTIALGYAALFCAQWSGGVVRGTVPWQVFINTVNMVALIAAFIVTAVQFTRISALPTFRTLPLTARQCAWLCLGYPCSTLLVLVPCIAIPFWLSNHGHLPTLLLIGYALGAGLSPLLLLITARFGFQFLLWALMLGTVLGGTFTYLLPAVNVHVSAPSPSDLLAGALATAAIGAIGYYGLCHLIESSSDIYKRTTSPPQFGQGVRR